ncbi:MAG: ABC transporter ATP-binding protein [bacterium]|nr:ABC transporter ATP-binding protein [bacterium]
MDNKIITQHVSKKFSRSLKSSMIYGLSDIVRNLLGQSSRPGILRKNEFWAVDQLSFELNRGETLGIIGPNGSGKSTMLKMLNGIYGPDKGKITVRGRVGALIEVGAGFHPMLTGKENIYVNGAILGMSKDEVDKKFDSIVEFADIGEFLAMPVKHYSSGMFVRLGFAIAVHCDPDILLIDEILAVGDVGFRLKCYNKIAELKKTCAIILVSHNMSAIFRTTTRCIVMNKGKQLFAGSTDNAIKAYNGLFENRDVERNKDEEGEAELESLLLYDAGGKSNVEFMHGVPLTIEMVVSIPSQYTSFDVSIAFINYEEEYIAQCHSRYNRFTLKNNDRKEIIKTTIPQLILNPGEYTLTVIISDTKTNRYLGWYQKLSPFKVKGNFYGGTNVQLLGKWEQIPYEKPGQDPLKRAVKSG